MRITKIAVTLINTVKHMYANNGLMWLLKADDLSPQGEYI